MADFNNQSRTAGGKPTGLTLKRGPNGKFILPLNQLKNVQLQLPQSFPSGGNFSVVFMQDNIGNTRHGVTNEDIKMSSIDDVQALYEVPRIVRSLENEAARAAKKLVAQKLLYQAAAPIEAKEELHPEFERLAIDANEVGKVFKANAEILSSSKPKGHEERLARNLLIEVLSHMDKSTKTLVNDLARNKQDLPKSLAALYKGLHIPVWISSKLMVKLPVVTNWLMYLFPKDGNKSIRCTHDEYTKLLSYSYGEALLGQSRALFDLLGCSDKSVGKVRDIEKSLPLLLPVDQRRNLYPWARGKPPTILLGSKVIEAVLNTMYRLNRSFLPLEEEARNEAIVLLFKDPNWDRGSEVPPLKQLWDMKDQKLVWSLNKDFNKILDLYGVPSHLVSAWVKMPTPKLYTEGPLDEKEVSLLEAPEVGYKLPASDNPGFRVFKEKVDKIGILQPASKKKGPKRLRTFIPKGCSKDLLEFVSKNVYFGPIRDQVEDFLSRYKRDEMREAGAFTLHAALLGVAQPRVIYDLGQEPSLEEEEGDLPENHQDED